MSESMAELIRLHSPIGRDEKGQHCTYCGHRYGYAAARTLHGKASDHIASVLAANGYGKLEDDDKIREAQADAWDECAGGYLDQLVSITLDWEELDNPYRKDAQ